MAEQNTRRHGPRTRMVEWHRVKKQKILRER